MAGAFRDSCATLRHLGNTKAGAFKPHHKAGRADDADGGAHFASLLSSLRASDAPNLVWLKFVSSTPTSAAISTSSRSPNVTGTGGTIIRTASTSLTFTGRKPASGSLAITSG